MARKPTLAYVVATNMEHPGLAIKFNGQINGFKTHFRTQFINFQYKGTDGTFLKVLKYIIFEVMALFAFMGNSRLYFRYDPKAILCNFYCMAFSLYKPVFIEHNGIFEKSLTTLGRHKEKKIHSVFMALYKFFPATHVGVTKEIQSYLKEKSIKNTHYMQNGYEKPDAIEELDDTLTTIMTDLNTNYKNIGIFVGNGYSWHGVDKLAPLFKDRKDCALIIVGKGYDDTETSDNIIKLGALSPGVLRSVFSHCDFGVSMFNPDMAGLTSPLKTREYLSYGLPVLVNFYDNAADFEAISPFLFKYYENEDAFENILKHSFSKVELTKLATEKFDWAKLLEFVI
jgi:hypothetical protein